MYGVLISAGIYISLLVTEKFARNKSFFWGAAFWCLIVGVTGARLYHIVDYQEYYLVNPNKIFAIWEGGMGIIGGIAAGILALYVYCKIKGGNFWHWADLAAISLPLAQSIGRWGNYFNNELFPTFVYESVLDMALFLILYFLYKKRKRGKDGFYFFVYLLGYSLVRLLVDFTRTNPWISPEIAVAVLAVSLLSLRRVL